MWQPSRRRGRGCYVQTWKSGNRPLLTRVKSFKYAEQNNTTQSHTRTIFACISTKHTSQGHELHTLLANFRKNRGEVPPKMVTITPPSIHHHHRSTTIIDMLPTQQSAPVTTASPVPQWLTHATASKEALAPGVVSAALNLEALERCAKSNDSACVHAWFES